MIGRLDRSSEGLWKFAVLIMLRFICWRALAQVMLASYSLGFDAILQVQGSELRLMAFLGICLRS